MTDQKPINNDSVQQSRFQCYQPERKQCNELARELGVPYLIAVLLWQRGLQSPDDAHNFINPQLASLPSPFLMKDMDKAVALVIQALQENWRIYIHGDYDVDGITSSALLARFFRQIGKKTSCYQPDRLKEGYGLQESFIRAKAPLQNETALLITVDCGISNIREVQIAQDLGFKVIVTDHHMPGSELPSADAILNPRLQECAFPFPSLAGVGVAFFLAYGIRNSLVESGALHKENAPNLKNLMDLVALGTVADVMPLTGINRILVRAGLEVMNQPDCIWALALQKQQNNFTATTFVSEDISYRFAPRINAPGRLGNPELAFALLSSDNSAECAELAAQIEMLNNQRKEHEAEALDQVIAECAEQDKSGASAFVVYGPFHQGIIGIIASRVIDRFNKPVIIFTDDASRLGTFRGSGRSIESVNLYDVIAACSDSVIQFGGHAMAAGLAIHRDNLHFFAKQFETAVAGLSIKDAVENVIPVDYCPTMEEVLNKEFLHYYKKLQPFGKGNSEPVFMVNKPEFIKTNAVKNHLTFEVRSNGQVYRGIGFGMAEKIKLIQNDSVQLAFKLKNTEYRGESRTELHIVELLAAV